MREFWTENSKTITKLMLNQFGAAFMGLMINAATSSNSWLMLFASVFATMFYLILLYNVIWERGGQDRIRVDGGRAESKPLTGLLVSLVANIPTIFMGVLILIGYVFGKAAFQYEWAMQLHDTTKIFSMIWNAMYMGFIKVFMPLNPLAHLLHVLPAVIVTAGGYLMGSNNKRIMGVFDLKPPTKPTTGHSGNTGVNDRTKTNHGKKK